jgi:hypothetical protein
MASRPKIVLSAIARASDRLTGSGLSWPESAPLPPWPSAPPVAWEPPVPVPRLSVRVPVGLPVCVPVPLVPVPLVPVPLMPVPPV